MFQDVLIRGYKFRVILDPDIKIIVMEESESVEDDPEFHFALIEAYDSWQDMVDMIRNDMGYY